MPYKDKEKQKAYQKAYQKTYQRAYRKAYIRAWEESNRVNRNAYKRAYSKADTNSLGVTKNSIRLRSNKYLFNTLKHTKLKDYQIHHCFGYDDYKSFIYIPKELHTQIHKFLRDNGIDADSNHFSKIVHLINAWNGYTYIKV